MALIAFFKVPPPHLIAGKWRVTYESAMGLRTYRHYDTEIEALRAPGKITEDSRGSGSFPDVGLSPGPGGTRFMPVPDWFRLMELMEGMREHHYAQLIRFAPVELQGPLTQLVTDFAERGVETLRQQDLAEAPGQYEQAGPDEA